MNGLSAAPLVMSQALLASLARSRVRRGCVASRSPLLPRFPPRAIPRANAEWWPRSCPRCGRMLLWGLGRRGGARHGSGGAALLGHRRQRRLRCATGGSWRDRGQCAPAPRLADVGRAGPAKGSSQSGLAQRCTPNALDPGGPASPATIDGPVCPCASARGLRPYRALPGRPAAAPPVRVLRDPGERPAHV